MYNNSSKNKENHTLSLAATAATKEEIEAAKEKMASGKVKPVKTERRVWRPKVTSQYKEPDCIPDPLEDLEILFKEHGKPIWIKKAPLPPRTDLIPFDKDAESEFKRNIQWKDCPPDKQPIFEKLIKEFWDVFAEEGVKHHIRGALFHVDTGEIVPVCSKPPRYGPHETRVINDLVEKLEKNGIIEDDDGPWGAPIVLAAKPNQEHLHWSQYTWRLCVSYRKLNAVTRPFTFPIVRCDDAVKEIGDSKFFITMDLDSGYWQVRCEPSSKAKLAFFTPAGKKRFTSMPMGATNAHPAFVALVAKFKKEWDEKAESLKLKNYQSQVIVDDIMISAHDETTLIKYFTCILEVLQHYRCTAKLKKCRFLPSVAEFVGLDIHKDGNAPAKSKFDAFTKLQRPNTFTDLNMLIGCFGFYQEHLALYEVRLKRWRNLQKLRPLPGTPKSKDAEILAKEWGEEDEKLLAELKEMIMSEPILKRPNSNARFYLKTDWSKFAMGAALLQPNTEDEKAAIAMQKEVEGNPCSFDMTKSGLRLHPIAFISRRTAGPEQSYHSYVGEACAGIWAIEKFRPYLFGREFTWLTDCSGLRKFFEGEDIPTHMIQRWRMQLLRYEFTIVHRPGRMMFECDMLSRYNRETEAWRSPTNRKESSLLEATKSLTIRNKPAPIPFTNTKIKFEPVDNPQIKQKHLRKCQKIKPSPEDWSQDDEAQAEALLEECHLQREVWMIGARMTAIPEALTDLGIDMTSCSIIDDDPIWANINNAISWEEAFTQASQTEQAPNWLIVPDTASCLEFDQQIKDLLELLVWKGLSTLIMCHDTLSGPSSKFVHVDWCRWLGQNLMEKTWGMTAVPACPAKAGACIEQDYILYVLGENNILDGVRNSRDNLLKNEGNHNIQTPGNMEDHINIHEKIQPLIISDERTARKQSLSRTAAVLRSEVRFEDDRWWPVFDIQGICPSLQEKAWKGPKSKPLIEYTTKEGKRITRELSWQEVARLLGKNEQTIAKFEASTLSEKTLTKELTIEAPKQLWIEILAIITSEEQKINSKRKESWSNYKSDHWNALTHMSAVKTTIPVFQTHIDRWTTIPLPTQRRWAEATIEDPDLRLIVVACEEERPLERHRLTNKKYFEAWDRGQLELDHGILFHLCEPKWTQIRQLRRRVTPKCLRHTVITGYHATPLAGHSGVFRTYWRIAARYWWPGMYNDIRQAVSSCAHCKLANAASHETQQILGAISSDTPFDVIALDVWSPGEASDKFGNIKGLTSLDTMTGFASVAVLQDITSETVARTAFASFFVPNGLPKLIILDAGSENKGMLKDMCNILKIKYHPVSPENHNGVLCERFHRYLNKVQRIASVNSQSFTQWSQGISFAAYSWNAAPIDGTNIIRSFVAKGRNFPFPLQISEEDNPERCPPGQGEEAIAHLETTFPLWAQQSLMLQTLIQERRERHRDMINQARKQRNFAPGDMVIIRKQFHSDANRGIPAKQKFKWKGIYKVLERAGENSYLVQKLPTLQGRGRPGKVLKYSSAVMERIPSSLVVHKNLDTSDTRLASLDQPLVPNPLEHNLGFHQYGKYVQVPSPTEFVFDKVEDLWSIDLDPDDEEEEELMENDQESPLEFRARLYRDFEKSTDKLCIIQMDNVNADGKPKSKKDWFVTQVDWNATSEEKAKKEGIYNLKWWMPHHSDVKRLPRRECRYWPEIRQILDDGTEGCIHPIGPGKVNHQILEKHNWRWYAYDMNLTKDMIVGPFDFVSINKYHNRIGEDVWKELIQKADPKLVDTSNIGRITPLP